MPLKCIKNPVDASAKTGFLVNRTSLGVKWRYLKSTFIFPRMIAMNV